MRDRTGPVACVALAALLGATGCATTGSDSARSVSAGSGISARGDRVAEGGIGGTGIAFGRITRLGSVVVNGAVFDLGQAAVVVDGRTVDGAALTPGAVVTVLAEKVTGEERRPALRVASNTALVGPVDGLDDGSGEMTGGGPVEQRFTVLGQRVRTEGATRWVKAFPGELARGDVVRIDGLPDSGGGVMATRVTRVSAPAGAVRLKARIGAVDAGDGALRIGATRVDYREADITTGARVDGLRVGAFAVVEGTLDAEGNVVARTVHVQSSVLDGGFVSPEIAVGHIEGVVDAVRTDGLSVSGLQMGLGADLEGSEAVAALRKGDRVRVVCDWRGGSWIARTLERLEGG